MKKNQLLHKIIRVLTIILALVLIAYVIILKWPQASVKSKNVDASISATEIYKAFSEDEQAAQTKYLGKVVQVSGIIDEMYEDEDGAMVVILRSSSSEPIAVITLESGESENLKKYREGQAIEIKALCSGMLMEVTFSKGIIVE